MVGVSIAWGLPLSHRRMPSSQTDPGAPALPFARLPYLNHACKWPGGVHPTLSLRSVAWSPLRCFLVPQSPSSHQLCSPARLTLPILRRSREEEQLKSCLWKLEGATWSPAHLSRSAQMVLLAAQNQALRPRAGTSTSGAHLELSAKDVGGPAVSGG